MKAMGNTATPNDNPSCRASIREASRALWLACKDALGVLAEWDDQSILWLKAYLRFRTLDAVVRLLGVTDSPAINWRKVRDQAEDRLCPWDGAQLLANLARWHEQEREPVLLRALLIHLLLHQAVQKEIKRRVSRRRYSKLWRDYLAEADQQKASGLLERLTQTEEVTQGRERKPLRKWYLLPHGQDQAERTALALEVLAELHALQRSGLSPVTLPRVPTAATQLSAHAVPGWDEAAPGLFAEDAQALQAEWLPVLEGTIESGPLKIRDALKAKYEYEAAQERNAWEYSFDALLEDPETEEEAPTDTAPDRRQIKTLEELRHTRRLGDQESQGWHGPATSPRKSLTQYFGEGGTDGMAKLRERLQYIKMHFKPPVQKAILLHRVEGCTQKEAAASAGTSIRSLTRALKILDASFGTSSR